MENKELSTNRAQSIRITLRKVSNACKCTWQVYYSSRSGLEFTVLLLLLSDLGKAVLTAFGSTSPLDRRTATS